MNDFDIIYIKKYQVFSNGMGFERLVKFITFVKSVKDCVAYPQFFKSVRKDKQ